MICKIYFASILFIAFAQMMIAQTMVLASESDASAKAIVEYEQKIKSILLEHCASCHGVEEQKAMLRLDILDPSFAGPSAETWHDVLDRLNLGDMPPEDQPPLPAGSRRQLIEWIRNNLDRIVSQRKGTTNQTTLRRLTRYEYNNTLRDLLGIDLDFAQDLPPDSSSPDGFKNNGETLGVSPLQIEYYLNAARFALDRAIVEGPAPKVYKQTEERYSVAKRPDDHSLGEGVLPQGKVFTKLEEYPREGKFVVRVMAGSSVPAGMGVPRMNVSLGMRSDTQSPAKTVGVVDVANTESEKRLYEFHGRMEEYPLPGHNPKFPGMTVTVTNAYNDGLKTPKPRKYRPIALTAEEKRKASEATKLNAPTLPVDDGEKLSKKLATNAKVVIGKLQRQVEELRLLSPQNPNLTDLAYRLFDIQTSISQEMGLIQDLAKDLDEDPADLLTRYRKTNHSILEDREQVLKRYREITPIDRKTKQFADPEPASPPRSTLVIDYIEFEGPIYERWPPAHHVRLIPDFDGTERQRALRAITSLMSRAYRRPVQDDDVLPVMKVYDKIRPASPSFEEAMRETLAMVLISPEFLYLVEPASEQSRPLDQYELASRLSYFLWSTMPDDRLRSLADSGELRDPVVLERQVRSMIADSRSRNFVDHFTNQWLDLAGLDRVAINPSYYPQFDDRIKSMMRQETQSFFGEVLRHDLSAMNLIDSDFMMLNEPLAKHYGIPQRDDYPRGGEFQRVRIASGESRGGLLTQGSFLMINSDGEDSHPIRRAVWLLDRLLGDPPAPPPPDVPDLNSEAPDFAKMPLKKQLELHRTKSACNDCHRGIDPWGIAFESFDAVGLHRDFVQRRVGRGMVKADVDDMTRLPDGSSIAGVDELKSYLIRNEKERFGRALASKVLSYALGRSLVLDDRETVDSLVRSFRKNRYVLSDLIVAIVLSEAFQTK